MDAPFTLDSDLWKSVSKGDFKAFRERISESARIEICDKQYSVSELEKLLEGVDSRYFPMVYYSTTVSDQPVDESSYYTEIRMKDAGSEFQSGKYAITTVWNEDNNPKLIFLMAQKL